jgi:hypothetical protein
MLAITPANGSVVSLQAPNFKAEIEKIEKSLASIDIGIRVVKEAKEVRRSLMLLR